MKKFHSIFKLWSTAISLVIILLVLSTATYAWFTSNKVVTTDKVSARSGEDTLELLIGSSSGSFSEDHECEIVQVNETLATELMPVSTADLKNFVYNPISNGDNAEIFKLVEDEQYYYHGRVYLVAESKGEMPGRKVHLYLDEDEEAGGPIVSADSGLLLNAARLGLTFDGENPVIFSLSDTSNPTDDQARNTVIGKDVLGDGQVLVPSGDTVAGVPDPSVPLATYKIEMDDSSVTLPEKPLLEMELNHVYQVDIYFYLEGCDPDCSDSINFHEADLHLGFYGIPVDEE